MIFVSLHWPLERPESDVVSLWRGGHSQMVGFQLFRGAFARVTYLSLNKTLVSSYTFWFRDMNRHVIVPYVALT